MRLSVPRLRRVLLGAGFLAGMAAAFAAGMCFPARSPAVCTQADLTVRPDAAPFSPAVSTMATAETQPNAALPEKWVCLTFDDGPSKTTPDVLSALNAAGVHGTLPTTTRNTCPCSPKRQQPGTRSHCTLPPTNTATSTAAAKPTGRTSPC